MSDALPGHSDFLRLGFILNLFVCLRAVVPSSVFNWLSFNSLIKYEFLSSSR